MWTPRPSVRNRVSPTERCVVFALTSVQASFIDVEKAGVFVKIARVTVIFHLRARIKFFSYFLYIFSDLNKLRQAISRRVIWFGLNWVSEVLIQCCWTLVVILDHRSRECFFLDWCKWNYIYECRLTLRDTLKVTDTLLNTVHTVTVKYSICSPVSTAQNTLLSNYLYLCSYLVKLLFVRTAIANKLCTYCNS